MPGKSVKIDSNTRLLAKRRPCPDYFGGVQFRSI